MLDLQKLSNNTSKKNNVRPGTYTATVTDICWTPGYVEGRAFTIHYELVSNSGKSYEYSETFFNTRRNARTDEFLDHLNAAGIEDINDFVGCVEDITIAKTADAYRSYSTISDRQFVSYPLANATVAASGTNPDDVA